ncbi:MAG: hypothetical protein A2148_06825 [Chloroflexi bacterium RBG_16_68_14]|nr:MAG: hypothetical protein A2148_06825 [Chloroflexi bacterium RBG_16_68_14]
MDVDSPVGPSMVVLGSARLPKGIGGNEASALMIELSIDSEDGRIEEVATTLLLPGYTALLRSLLIGRRLDEVEGAAQQLGARLRGALLRPTVAALANAVSHGTHREGALAAGRDGASWAEIPRW